VAAAAGATASASTAGAGEAAGAGDIDNSAEILGFASGLGGFGRRRDGRPNLAYRDFVPSPDQSP